MDGKSARQFVEHLVTAHAKKQLIQKKLTYDFLNQGAEEFVSLVECIRETQAITTVADQANYDLNADYLRIYLKDDEKRAGHFYLPYNDGTTTYMLLWRAYQKVIYDNLTTSQSIPSNFTIHEKTSLASQVTGTTTSGGNESGGQSTLTDSTATFSTSASVSPRDIVHNSSKDATGVVLSVSSNTALTTAMFDQDGNLVGWSSGDTYVIQPCARMQLQFDPPPSTASHTATLYYVAKPNPVYTDFGTWQINDIYHKAFCYYAADLYLARAEEIEPGKGFVVIGEKFKTKFMDLVRSARKDHDLALGKTGYSKRMEA